MTGDTALLYSEMANSLAGVIEHGPPRSGLELKAMILERSKQQRGPLRLRSGQAFNYVWLAPHFVQDDRISKGREEEKMSDLHLEPRR
jgi:hypothetical protein